MSDEVEFPGVYVDESAPGHPIERRQHDIDSWVGLDDAVCAGVIALGAYRAVSALSRRRVPQVQADALTAGRSAPQSRD